MDDYENDLREIINVGDHSELPALHPPSHVRPLYATAKPGSQAVQEKEPSVLVQAPVGHAPGFWHSSMSNGQ